MCLMITVLIIHEKNAFEQMVERKKIVGKSRIFWHPGEEEKGLGAGAGATFGKKWEMKEKSCGTAGKGRKKGIKMNVGQYI